MLLRDRAVVVTGAANGIGRAIATLFAEEGASVVLADIDLNKAQEAAAEIMSAGHAALAFRADVSKEDDVEACVAAAVDTYGRLDVMVNNAGVPRDSPIEAMTLDVWQSVVDVHLRGVWLGVRAGAAAMRRQRSGSIINMSSMSGLLGFSGQTNYSAAKAGIIGLTKSAARELGPDNIRVNAIAPGTIRTERTGNLSADTWAAKVANVSLGREGAPQEVANAALFLASDMSSYVSAVVLEVAGGRL